MEVGRASLYFIPSAIRSYWRSREAVKSVKFSKIILAATQRLD